MSDKKIAIIGSVGVPASYGGFETLCDNLVRFHASEHLDDSLTVFCSSKHYLVQRKFYLKAKLKYIPLSANGVSSIPYDIWSLIVSIWSRSDVILLLGVSGALALPLVRLLSSARIVTNIDGIEWRREKWKGLAKHYLRFSEKLAVLFSHDVVADNSVIGDYVKRTYDVDSHVIAYGGDHAMSVERDSIANFNLPSSYAFSVCRIEPENNIHIILDAFSRTPSKSIVIIGNWDSSEYGLNLKIKYRDFTNLILLNPVYELSKLKTFRQNASYIIHGHSAGGTNPTLVEAMHFGKIILAFDCDFNRSTTENKALYFKDSNDLLALIHACDLQKFENIEAFMKEIAERRYTWHIVAQQYFSLMSS
ncbi:DUF1972 domain-containing protein [Undibacterium sp. RuRC25W]|uniref:DUF1972 domain-containing protein n=1 Tax=Undibacterium sp. RuRC25W TaxID=3413047 RepID=UPI003BF24044